jgi:hypothetical protein
MNISNNIHNFVPIGHAITNIQNVQIPLRNYSTIYGNVVGILLISFQIDISYGLQM